MMDDGAVTTVDTRGMRCPWPALRLARAMRTLRAVRLIADDPQAGREVSALAAEQGWRIAERDADKALICWDVMRD